MTHLRGISGYGVSMSEVASHSFRRLPEVLLKQLWARLRFGYGPEVFFLFDMQNRPIKTWSSYIPSGNRAAKALRAVNNKNRRAYTTTDKLATADRLRLANVPCAEILGVVGRTDSTFQLNGNYRFIQDNESLVAFLNSPECPGSLFFKPAWGQKGQGVLSASQLRTGWKVGVEEVTPQALAARVFGESDRYGRLIQPVLRNHSEIEQITGNVGLSTVRLVTACTKDGPKVLVATQKLIGERSLADNFLGGATGNLIASVDIRSGALGLCYGRRKGDRYLMTQYDSHPVTGCRVLGVVLPYWQKTLEVAAAAAQALEDEPFLGFDVAITDEGPVVLEANNDWSWALPQITARMGGRAIFGDVLNLLKIPEVDRASAINSIFGR